MDHQSTTVDVPATSSPAGGSKLNSFFNIKGEMTWKKRIMWWAIILGSYLVACWVLVIYDKIVAEHKNLKYHGIIPRTTKGLIGLISGPFLHEGIRHVAVDSTGVIILGGFLMLASLKTFFVVTGFVWVGACFFTWCVARSGYSIIGSGLICFGWFGYLVVTPFFQRPISIKNILIAVVTGILYCGLIFAVFKGGERQAWEANLCSLFVGVMCAIVYWFLLMRLLPKHFAKFQNFKNKISSPSSSSDPSTFQTEDPQTGAVILPQPQNDVLSGPQKKVLKNALLDERVSPFGAQEQQQQQQQQNRNTSEPSWLQDNKNYSSPKLSMQQPQAFTMPAPPQQNNNNNQFDPFNNNNSYTNNNTGKNTNSSNPDWLMD